MRYKLMNDYSAMWPFWGGKDGAGLCTDDDPVLPDEIAAAARAWASQFNEQFDYLKGWPDQATATAHEAEGERLYEAVKRALPADEVTFRYWSVPYRAVDERETQEDPPAGSRFRGVEHVTQE